MLLIDILPTLRCLFCSKYRRERHNSLGGIVLKRINRHGGMIWVPSELLDRRSHQNAIVYKHGMHTRIISVQERKKKKGWVKGI